MKINEPVSGSLKIDETGDRITFFKNLDGLRAIAAFAVIFAHLTYWFPFPENDFYYSLKFILSFDGYGGRFGVIFFFVLSGFLITYLMFLENFKKGKFNVLHFYFRRILRIWPLYYISIVIGFFIYRLFVPYPENASFFLYSVFAANFDHIYNGYPSTGILGVQWSVAVEEQFYLIWPLLFVLFSRKNYFWLLLLIIILISELFYFLSGADLQAGDYHFGSCIRYLSFGGFLAYFCFHHQSSVTKYVSLLSKKLNFSIYLFSILFLFFQNYLLENIPVYKYFYHIVPVLFFGFVIIEQNFSANSFYKIGSSQLLNWCGKISYGLYLIHMIAINIVLLVFPTKPEYVLLLSAISLLLTVLLSYLSYNYFEKYFLSLKNKYFVS